MCGLYGKRFLDGGYEPGFERERSRRKITLRPVNTPTGGQMKQTVEASKTAPLFLAFLQLKG